MSNCDVVCFWWASLRDVLQTGVREHELGQPGTELPDWTQTEHFNAARFGRSKSLSWA